MIYFINTLSEDVSRPYLFRNWRCIGCQYWKPGTRHYKVPYRPMWEYRQTLNVCTEWFDNNWECPKDREFSSDKMSENIEKGWQTRR